MIWYVNLNNSISLLTKYSDEDSKDDVVIPKKNADNRIIKIIGVGAFNERRIKSLVMNNEITEIGRYGISNCELLLSITSSKKLRVIRHYSICNNYKLKEFNFEKELQEIGEYSFSSDIALKEADLTKCKKLKSTGPYMFYDCEGLSTVALPQGMVTVAEGTFCKCVGLNTAFFPSSIHSFEAHSLEYTAIKEFISPKSTKSVGPYALANNPDLVFVRLNDNINYIGEHCFENDVALLSIAFPKKIKTVNSYVCSNCKSLRSAFLQESVGEICEGAFAESGLEGVFYLPNSVKKIDKWAFKDCVGITEIFFSTFIEYIDDEAFSGCKLTIRAEKGSYAHEYAKRNKIPYKRI